MCQIIKPKFLSELPENDENGHSFLANHPTADTFAKIDGPIVIRILDIYVCSHNVSHSPRLDQARSIGNEVKAFCFENFFDTIGAPANNHCTRGLVERLIQKIKLRLAGIKSKTSTAFSLNVKTALKFLKKHHYAYAIKRQHGNNGSILGEEIVLHISVRKTLRDRKDLEVERYKTPELGVAHERDAPAADVESCYICSTHIGR